MTFDERRGHIHMHIPDRGAPGEAGGGHIDVIELGSLAQLSADVVLLNPADARRLAALLNRWADRRDLYDETPDGSQMDLLDALEGP